MSDPLLLGLDVGTGGVRAVAVAADGRLVARGEAPLVAGRGPRADGRHEQDALDWWRATGLAIRRVVDALASAGTSPSSICGLAVDGTSGTVVGVDSGGEPVGPAMMYNDLRAAVQATQLGRRHPEFCEKLG